MVIVNLKGRDNGVGCMPSAAAMLNQYEYHNAINFAEAEMMLFARWLRADTFADAVSPPGPGVV